MKEPNKDIPTVTAPVLVVEAGAPEPEPAHMQEIKRLILEMTARESAKRTAKVEPARNPPYILVVLLMVLLGFAAVILLVTIRPDLDFVVVAGVILPTVTVITTSVFNIIQRNLTIQEAHEANINSQLALVQAKETHDVVNHRIDEFKELFVKAEEAKSKVAAVEAHEEGRVSGRDTANERTDALKAQEK